MKWYTSSSFSATLDSSGTMGWGGWKLLCTRRMLSLLLIASPGTHTEVVTSNEPDCMEDQSGPHTIQAHALSVAAESKRRFNMA